MMATRLMVGTAVMLTLAAAFVTTASARQLPGFVHADDTSYESGGYLYMSGSVSTDLPASGAGLLTLFQPGYADPYTPDSCTFNLGFGCTLDGGAHYTAGECHIVVVDADTTLGKDSDAGLYGC